MTGETINKMTGEVIDHNYDGVIMLSKDIVYFNDAQPRPDGRKIYHIFEQCPSSVDGETSEVKPNVEDLELFSKASENNIEHIREVLACNGILYDEWCPPITPLSENFNGNCQKKWKRALLIRSKKWRKNGKENVQNGKIKISEKIFNKHNNHKTPLPNTSKTAKVRLSKSKDDPLYIPEQDKLYRCDKCSFCCDVKCNLKYHQITHLSRKVHSCSLCSFKTNYKSNFKGHLLTVHELSQEKCLEEISKAFSKRKNNDDKTPSLKKSKTTKSSVAKLEEDPLHVPEKNVNSDEKCKVYRCNKCNFWSEKKHILKYHQITHPDKKVFSCSYCSFQTYYKGNLKSHLLTVHNLSQEECLEELSEIQNINTVLDSEDTKVNCEPLTLSENHSDMFPEENISEKFVSSIRLKKEVGNENGMIPCYNIVEKETLNNICNEIADKLKLPDVKVVLTRLSPEMVAAYTQHRRLKLTITKLEKEIMMGFSRYNMSEIKKGRSIILSKRILVRKQKSKYCRIKALRYKRRNVPKMEFPEILYCSHCDFKTRKKNLLRNHIFRDHDLVYSCAECGYSFLSEYELEKHILSHKEYRCRKCDYTSHSKYRLAKHESSHNRTFFCDKCIFSCSSEEELLRHDIKLHPKKEKLLKCRYCSFTCKERNDLDNHNLSHLDVGTFRCRFCTFSTNNELELTEHNLSHPRRGGMYRCSKCNYKSAIKASVKQHELSHLNTKMFKCSHCNYATNYKGNLRTHEINNHTENKKYKCNQCEYSAQFQKYLDLHLISHMEGEVLKCLFCKFTSELKTVLRTHIIEEHHTQGPSRFRVPMNNSKEFACEHCPFTTNSRTGYNQHKKTHLSVKEFECSFCEYATNFKGNLLKHRLVHINIDPLSL
ncbi:Zinc finger X-chromosomal protein [Armadillidium vulgare]|nr:Zinc finger X-chromosomal protein [Armadillidium vulgare]